MSSSLIFTIISIILALVLYTVGVFAQRKSNSLNTINIILFWIGFICYSIGIYTIGPIHQSGEDIATATLQSLTSMLSVFLMLFNTVWATWALIRNNELQKKAYRKFSLILWIVWLVPCIIDIMLAMGR